MDVGRVGIIIVFVAFLLIFLASNFNANGKFGEAIPSYEVSLNIQGIDDATANEIWVHCSGELKDCIHFLESLQLNRTQASSRQDNLNLDADILTQSITEEVIPNLPFKEKQFLFECLRNKRLLDHETGGEFGSNTRFHNCQKLFSRWSTVPRRLLRHKVRHLYAVNLAPARARGPALAPAPAPVPVVASPEYAPAPSYIAPASSPSLILQPLSPDIQPPPSKPSPPRHIIHPPPPSIVIHHPPPSSDAVTPSRKYEAAIIVASSVGALALVVLVLFFCTCRREDQISPGNGPKDGKRFERPLLNLFSSDVPAGSSQKFQSLGNLSNTNFKTSSTVSNIAVATDNTNSSVQTQLATIDASENNHALLPLPPGRSAPPPSAPAVAPPPPPKPPATAPPPPPKVARAPPNPPKSSNFTKPWPLGGHNQGRSSASDGSQMTTDSDAPKAKLKPFFWEKLMANPDHSMVWNEIKAGSFQFNEEMMESLFGYAPADRGKYEHNRGGLSSESAPTYIQIIDQKKSRNLAILLKALNVTTEEVCDALKEGNELPIELVENLVKMAPTVDEELKLRLFSGDLSQLGPAERFLKVIVEIPFAFKRMESLLFMSYFQEETSSVAESLATLEVACNELKNSRLFLKLLEAVLKTGNRMNVGTYRGGAMAFKLDTLLKLSDVKGIDGKTTLLHFVVQEIIRSEGLKAARRLRASQSISSVKTEDFAEESSRETTEYHRNLGLQVVSGLSNDLVNVRKAAHIDGDHLVGVVSSLSQSLLKTKNFLSNEMMSVEEDSEFCNTLSSFIQQAEDEIVKLLEEEKMIMTLVKNTGEFFHGSAGKDEGLRLFVIVRDFLIMLDKECKNVKNLTKEPAKTHQKGALEPSSSQESHLDSAPDFHRLLFPAIKERRAEDSSSDEDN